MKFMDALADKRMLFDGAMGTELQKLNPTIDDYPDKQVGFGDGLILTHPEWIKTIHESYLNAGADVIETNTFGSNGIKLREYNMEDRMDEINNTAVSVAKEAGDGYDGTYIGGSMGLTGLTPSLQTDDDMLDDIEETYRNQARSLEKAGVDLLILETCQDLLELKSAIIGTKEGSDLPLMVSITLALNDTMLFGTKIDAAYASVAGMDIDIFGINCSTGPAEMETALGWLNNNTEVPLSLIPNAGIPLNGVDGAMFPLKADEMAQIMSKFCKKYGKNLKIIGGCCGTTPNHIRNLRNVLDS